MGQQRQGDREQAALPMRNLVPLANSERQGQVGDVRWVPVEQSPDGPNCEQSGARRIVVALDGLDYLKGSKRMLVHTPLIES